MPSFKAQFIFLVLYCSFAQSVKKLPSYLTLCHANDPKIEDCFKNAVEQLRPHFKKGIPELQIPSMDPLVVPQAGLKSGAFSAGFKNIRIYFADEFEITRMKVDLPKNYLEIGLNFPRLRVLSEYNFEGKLLIFQLVGHGPADGNFTDISGTAVIDGKRTTRKGREYIQVGDHKLTLKLGKPHFQFDHLFKDNEVLTRQTNQALNDNIVDIIEELRPVIENVVGEFVFGVAERIFTRFSLNELFPQ